MQEGTDQWEEAKQDLTDTIKYRRMLGNESSWPMCAPGWNSSSKTARLHWTRPTPPNRGWAGSWMQPGSGCRCCEELEKNMDGYQNSVKAVMRAAGARRLRGIIGPVSAILKVEPGCEVTVETALGAALQNIVVENEAAAKAAIALLRSDNAGRATFLPLDTVQPGVFRGRLSGTARLASSLVQADARYDNIVSNLLGRIIVVEDINEASRVARDNGFRSRVVTMDGQVINAGGSFTGGSVQRSAGLFTRKQEMEELRMEGRKAYRTALPAGKKTDQCKEQADALQAGLTATASEQITAANDRVRAEAEQKRLEAAAAQLETARNARRQEIDTLQAAQRPSRGKVDAAAKAAGRTDGKDRPADRRDDRIAEGSDSFLAQQNQLGTDPQRQAAGTGDPPEGRGAGLQPDRRAGTAGQGCCRPPNLTGRERGGTGRPQRCLPCRDRGHPADPRRQPDHHRPKEKAIREATRNVWPPAGETEALACPHTSADSREKWAARWPVASARPLPRPKSTTRPWQSCRMSTSSQSSQGAPLCGVRQPARFAGAGGRPARQDPCAGQRERERH